ncbi:MAG TPA: MFS transporter [Polyangiaceae bacterium]|nr:MFS transporter [Polyangiaceae bacterium]
MRLTLRNVVDLRPGESGVFVRAFGVLLLTVAGHTLLETARDALFLARLPPRSLTYVYVMVAVGAVVIAPLSSRLARFTGARSALVISLVLAAFGAAWFRVREPSPSVVFGLYVFGTLSATLLIGQFWALAGSMFSASQGRRLFGALASGGVLGAIVAAAIAASLLGSFDVRVLLAGSATAYFGAAWLATTIETEPVASTPAGGGMQKDLGRVRREPLVLKLAAITGISMLAAVVIDYLFKARVAQALRPSDLAPFFAKYQLFLNIASLTLQVTVAGPLVERLGVVGLAVISPTLLALGGVSTLISGAALPLVVMLKATDSTLRNSLGRVSMELFWAPVEQQARLRGAVDIVISRGAQAVAGAVLFAASASGRISNFVLASAAAGLAVIWLVLSWGTRKPYIELFRSALGQGNIGREWALAELDLTAVETVVEALARPDAGEVIAAMNLLAERGRVRLVPALILYHDSPDVLKRALELFGAGPRKDWYPLGRRLLDHADPSVQNAAVRAFALSGADAELERAAQHEHPSVRGFAALYLAQRQGRTMQGAPLSWPLFAADSATHPLKRAFIEALAANPTPDAPKLLLAFAAEPELASAVTAAMEHAADPECIPFLIERLGVADDRMAAGRALVRLREPAFAALIDALRTRQLPRRVRIHIPRTISAFENDAAATELLQILRSDHEGLIRYKALRGLEQLARSTTVRIASEPILQEIERNALEHLRLFALVHVIGSAGEDAERLELVLVRELLEDKLHQSLDRLARLVQLAHRSDDIPTLFAALNDADRRRRAQAVEFLDALIRSLSRASVETAGLLRLVVDDLSPQERVRRSSERIGVIPHLHDALTRLSEDPDQILRELARHASTVWRSPQSRHPAAGPQALGGTQ